MKIFIVQNIKLPIEASKDDVFAEAKQRLLKFFSNESIVSLEIYKSSVDARRKGHILFCLFRICRHSGGAAADAGTPLRMGLSPLRAIRSRVQNLERSLCQNGR